MIRTSLLCAVILQAVCGQRSFKLITTKMSWSDARDFCQTNYDDLADAENLVELASLVSTVNLGGAWIGLYYDSNASTPRWSTGATYSWMPNVSSLSTGKCTMLLFMTSMPSSVKCSSENAFICLYHQRTPRSSTMLAANAKLPSSTNQPSERIPPDYILILDGTSKVTSTAPMIERGVTTNPPGEILARPTGGSTAGTGGGNALAPFSEVANLTTGTLLEEVVLAPYETVGGLEPIMTNRPQDIKGAGYLVVKVDFVSFVPKNIERKKMLLLTTVQELLEGRLPKDSFQLRWVGSENLS